MPRWAMAVDIEKCTGCQTCSIACKVANALAPTLQRVAVIEKETGKYPDVQRIYIPRRCMNCSDPQCVEVCPSGATEKGDDGIVTINQDTCIGCRYCMMACPYNARLFHGVAESYHPEPSEWELKRYPEHAVGVVDKCDFCKSRVDEGLEAGLTPGVDPDASPVCVGACIADALTFGDLDDPDSEISTLIASRGGLQLLEEMKTDPAVYYLPKRTGSRT